MALQEIHSWTLGGLIGAFIDLFVAYFLLCGSAIAFFASIFFRFFELYFPCPCKGSFGFKSSNFCLHKILFEWPSRKICSIQVMAAKRFPFDLVRVKCHSCNANDKMVAEKVSDNRLVDLEDEASCSSCSGPRLLSLVDKENGYDAKGKRIMSLKRRSGIRRRRKGNYDCGKASMVIPSDNLQSDVGLTSCLPCYGSIIRDKISESINPASGKEVSVIDDEGAQTGHDLCEKSCHSYEFDGSMVDSPVLEKYSSTLEHYMSNVQHNVQIIQNEENRIKMLENELEEEKAAYAALYLVLEKERAAAASPGLDKKSSSLEHYTSNEQDNVQIVRNEENRIKMLENTLEEEKAAAASPGQDKKSSSLEHYMSNEQDNVQIVRNEENCIKILEKALEEEKAAYAALYLELEKERAAAATAADEAMAMISRLQEEKASVEMEMRQYLRMIEERVSYDEEEMNILEEILIRRERENHFLEKELEAYRQMDLKGSDQSNDKPKLQLDEWGQRPQLSVETHEDPLQSESTISIVKKDEASNISSNYMITQTCIDTDVEELEKNTEHKDQMHSDMHSSFCDTEPDVLDVHVVDDNIKLREEENEKLSSSLFSTVSNESRNSYLEFGTVAVPSTNTVSNCPRTSKTENENSDDGPTSQLSMFYNSRCKTLLFDSESDSSSAVHNEKLKIDNEIEILGERLRMVKQEKEKLTLFAENVESEKRRLELLEEIANHLQQIKQLRNPVRGASLPPSSSKVSLRKRRCQSASWETCESS